MIKQGRTLLVENSRCLTSGVDDLEELFEEFRCLKCGLSFVFMDIEHAALCPRGG
jgi:hypothetical protein